MTQWLAQYWDLFRSNVLAFLLFGIAVGGLAVAITKTLVGAALETCRERLAAVQEDLARLKGEKSELMGRLKEHGEDIRKLKVDLAQLPMIYVSAEAPPDDKAKNGDLWIQPSPEIAEARDDPFSRVLELIPDLIREMKEDLRAPGNRTIRQFFIAPTRGVIIRSSQQRFVYYENEHDDLRGKVNVLENHGYVHDVTTGNIPTYQMTEDLVRHLTEP